jgi:hypothetical protein
VLARALSCNLSWPNVAKSENMEGQRKGMDIFDFDEPRGHDDKAFGNPRAATGDDGQLSGHFGFARHGSELLASEIICSAELAG